FYQSSGLLDDPTGGTPGLDVTTGQGADTITVTNTPGFTDINLNNSTGTDQLNVQGMTGQLDIFTNRPPGQGPKTVVVGSNAPKTGGTLANINGIVDLVDYSNTNLVVDDSGDTTARTVTMTDPDDGLISGDGKITGLTPAA